MIRVANEESGSHHRPSGNWRASTSPSIEIRRHQTPADLTIEVHDNGRGLPEDDAAKVLTPFFSTKAGGGGIGLNVARHVALAHGGQLRVRRGDTAGAVFSLVLPAA